MFKPFDYQIQGAKGIRDFGGRCLLADDMGLGKTVQALMFLKKTPDAWPACVVCPASVKYGWEHHALTVAGVHASVLEGKRALPPKHARLRERAFIVVNYDILPQWEAYIKALKVKTLIIDEIHYCANRETKRTKSCKVLSRRAKYVLGLSGTPLVNRPSELWPGLNMIRPDKFNSFWAFGQRYCGAKLGPWGWEYKGASRVKELRKVLRQTCMIRRTKMQVMDELPARTRSTVLVPLSNRNEYQYAKKSFINWLRGQDISRAERAKKARVLAHTVYLKKLVGELKLQGCINFINNWLKSSDKKVVVFCIHKEFIRRAREATQARSVVITGDTPGNMRKRAIREFRENNKTRVMFGNMQAMGTGVDGLQVASTGIFAELSWRVGDHTQAEGRLDRIGQQEPCMFYYLMAADTIEERICRVIQEKHDVVSSILDGDRKHEEFDIWDLLLEEMQEAA